MFHRHSFVKARLLVCIWVFILLVVAKNGENWEIRKSYLCKLPWWAVPAPACEQNLQIQMYNTYIYIYISNSPAGNPATVPGMLKVPRWENGKEENTILWKKRGHLSQFVCHVFHRWEATPALCLRMAWTFKCSRGENYRHFVFCSFGVWLDGVAVNPHSACEVPYIFREIEGGNYRHFFDMRWNRGGHYREFFHVFFWGCKCFLDAFWSHFQVILGEF